MADHADHFLNGILSQLYRVGPTEDERRRAATQAMARMGLGILAANQPSATPRNPWGVLAQGGLGGMDAYESQLRQQQQDRMANQGLQIKGVLAQRELNKPIVVGRTLMTPTGATLAEDPTVSREKTSDRESREYLATQAAEERRAAQEREQAFRAEQARIAAADREALLRAGQAGRTPPAPLIKDIVDPLNPNRMISVDVRTFKEGRYLMGDKTGVVGVAGKEPTAAKREEKESQGKELLRTELDNLREHYRALNESRAIPSSDRGGISNTAAWLQGSAAGQLGGRMLGTKEQDARNQIQSARLRIMNAIKNATGMSAQQLNSNIELKTWLDSLTSLTGSYESNVGIIDAIEKAFLAPKSSAPDIDKILEKYK